MTRSHAQKYTPSQDDYPDDRCRCGHIFYIDDTIGGWCRWSLLPNTPCDCDDHRRPVDRTDGGEES